MFTFKWTSDKIRADNGSELNVTANYYVIEVEAFAVAKILAQTIIASHSELYNPKLVQFRALFEKYTLGSS